MLWNPAIQEPKVDQVGLLLLDAADAMEQRGWCRDHFSNWTGNVCLVGALQKVTTSADALKRAEYRLYTYLGRESVYWNDEVCPSKEAAVAALRGAAWMSSSE